MIEFTSIDISPAVSSDSVRDIIAREIPDFSWRRGESDDQGKYISGTRKGTKIQCWVDEMPMAMSVSFRNSKLNADERNELINSFLEKIIPQFGKVCKIEYKRS